MRTAVGTCILLLAGAGALASYAAPQSVRSGSIEIVVQQPDRTFVTTVAPADLQMAIGGTPVAVDRVERVSEPVSVVVLVDLSLSATTWAPNRLPDPADPRGMVAAIEREFARKLPPSDRARVGWFAGSTIRVDSTFRSDRAALATAVGELLIRQGPSHVDAFGPSPMADAVSSVVELFREERGRRAILLISDGESSANHISLQDAALRASNARVAVHAMLDALEVREERRGWSTLMRYPPHFDRGRLLSRLAGMTGGAFSRDDRFSGFSWGFTMPMPPFEYFFTAMHSGMRVTFSGTNLTAGAPIEVTPKDPKWLVSAPRWLPAEP